MLSNKKVDILNEVCGKDKIKEGPGTRDKGQETRDKKENPTRDVPNFQYFYPII
jgi:hypothetical protein